MYQIGILTKPDRFLLRVRSALAQSDQFKAVVLDRASDSVEILNSQSLDGIIVVLDSFEDLPLEIVRKIRLLFQIKPMIITGQKPPLDLVREVSKMKNTILMSSESEVDNISLALQKMFSGKSVKNREFKRHKTMQSATLVGSKHPRAAALLLDLAVGGAQVRSFSGDWKRGDHLDLHIPLPSLNKIHLLKSEVVWVREERILTQEKVSSMRLGLRFVDV